MAFINLIPHEIRLISKDGTLIVLPPAKTPARVDHNVLTTTVHDGVPVKCIVGPVGLVGLPDPQEGVFFVVSRIVKDLCQDRDDLVVPADILKDHRGHIVGARAVAL